MTIIITIWQKFHVFRSVDEFFIALFYFIAILHNLEANHPYLSPI